MKSYPHVKLNFGLNVLRKRPDGYHDIETLMVPYTGICDELEIERIPGEPDGMLEISIDGPLVDWDPRSDLTAKAYGILSGEHPLPATRIHLIKRSPVGAGLGGGSSDGVAALKMLNEMYSLGVGLKEMEGLAARLGSDCPFFVSDVPCICSGKGEVMEAFSIDLSGFEIRVCIPEGVSVRTGEAYGGITPHLPERPLKEILRLPVEEWKDCLVNDFEESVFPLHPEIARLKEKLYSEGAVYASMSGSGSSVFALFRK